MGVDYSGGRHSLRRVARPAPTRSRSCSERQGAGSGSDGGRHGAPAIASAPTRADNAVTMKTTKRPRKAATAPGKAEGLAGFHIRAERLAAGKALRQRVPRESHGDWRPPRKARDPVEILERSNRGRLPELVPIRYGRMSASPFTFFRGSAALMAHDLATTPTTGIDVQACGDCHLLNFGGFATPERNLVFDLNDFDETLPAPWEWDLKRLVVSFVVAARDNGLSDDDGRQAALACVRAYREHLRECSRQRPLEVWYAAAGRGDPDRRGARAPRNDGSGSRSRTGRASASSKTSSRRSRGRSAGATGSSTSRRSCSTSREPGFEERVRGGLGRTTATRCPTIAACCSTAIAWTTTRSRWSASAASGRAASSAACSPRTAIR